MEIVVGIMLLFAVGLVLGWLFGQAQTSSFYESKEAEEKRQEKEQRLRLDVDELKRKMDNGR